MQSRSARLVSAALRNDKGVGEWSPEPSTSGGVQHSVQASSSEHVVAPLSVLDTESDFDSDDSVLDKNYELPKVREKNSDTDGTDSEDFIPCSQPLPAKTILESPAESEDEETNHVQLTKKGTIRKRKTYNNPLIDGRGHNPNPRKLDNTKIIEHIMSFRPAVSHYRREHAPNKKYLPSDLSIRIMYDHYCENEPETKVSYGFYRKLVKELNISFAKLGHEECEQCEKFTIHNPNSEIRHRARKKYEEDADNQTQKKNNADTIIFAVDLEKVIMLPRMDEFKTVMFCPRLIVFNQSFVPLGDKKYTKLVTLLLFYGTKERLAEKKKRTLLKDLKQGIPAPRQKHTPRGITSERKSAILTKLGPLMPANRRHFWESLPVNDGSADLTHIHED
ncbi:hypothetical protein HF086_006451 [Spodoptera exigua]|uniref:Uncharacterized protein n=1 Tax=Spodoptera exigua TaxID=7107 RepID=A0A922SDS0_SPOEX|nr:hypothetical protein HF086_006451 [Spodoptera exigua]